MNLKKILAGAVAFVMLANLGTSAVAESGGAIGSAVTAADSVYSSAEGAEEAAEPFVTIGEGQSYEIPLQALFKDEQLAKLSYIEIETRSDAEANVKSIGEVTLIASDGNTIRYEPFEAGETWIEVVPNYKKFTTATIECTRVGDDGGIGITAIRFMDENNDEFFRIDADNQPKPFCTLDLGDSFTLETDYILRNIANASRISSVGVRTFGTGKLALKYYYDVPGEDSFMSVENETESQPAGGLALFTGINLSDIDTNMEIVPKLETPEDIVGLYAVDLYDYDGNLIVTLDASNMYLNSFHAPILDADITPEKPESESLYIYTKSVLGANVSKVASVEVTAYGCGKAVLRSAGGDKTVDCTGLNTYEMTIEPGAPVLELVAKSGRVAVMSVAFRDYNNEILEVLNGGNINRLNVRRTSVAAVAELTKGEVYTINTKQLLKDSMSELSYIEFTINGFGKYEVNYYDNNGINTPFEVESFTNNAVSMPILSSMSEAHGNIYFTCKDGYQSIGSITFYRSNGIKMLELTPENAALNTEKVDCTNFTRFELYNYSLANGAELRFDPINAKQGCKMAIEFVVPADISDENPVEFSVFTDTDEEKNKLLANYSFGSDYCTDSEYTTSILFWIDDSDAELFGKNGFKITGNSNAVITSVEIGYIPAPTELRLVPSAGGLMLSWQGNHCENCEYEIYLVSEMDSCVCIDTTSETEYFMPYIDPKRAYTFAVVARHSNIFSYVLDATISYPYEVKSHSLSLGDEIGVNYYIHFADFITEDPTAEVRFTVNGRETAVPISSASHTERGYRFTVRVAAAEMNDTITGQLYINGEAVFDPFTYSVRKYSDYIYTHISEYERVVPLVDAMLNYGAAAEKFFRGKTDMSFTKPDVTERDLEPYKHTVTYNDSKIKFVGHALSLKSKVAIKLYFDSAFTMNDVSVSCGEMEVDPSCLTIGSDKNGTYLAITDITPCSMGVPFDITVGGVTISNYSCYSYVLCVLDRNSALTDVALALYEYGRVAESYDFS